MTSLIDVIFLLLLFFMLSSTFTRFAEVELTSGGGGATDQDTAPIFAQVGPDDLRINGTTVALSEIGTRLAELTNDDADAPLLIALKSGVTAQRLTDVLVGLRDVPGISVTVLDRS